MRLALAVAALAGCRSDEGVAVRFDAVAADAGDFWALPWPSALRPDARLPNPAGNAFVDRVLAASTRQRGASGVGALFFAFDGALDAGALPDFAGSLEDSAPVALIGPDGARVPVTVDFRADGGPFGAPNLLAIRPLPGFPLQPGADYLAVVSRSLGDAAGDPLGRSDGFVAAMAEEPLAGRIAAAGLDPRDLAAASWVTIADPTVDTQRVVDAFGAAAPAAPAFALAETWPGYCVFHAVVDLPVYQEGAPPYLSAGGGIGWDGDTPTLGHVEPADLWVTLPRSAAPAAGFPVAVMVQTGGGGDRPLIDRGVRDADGVAAPGTGLAVELAAEGFVGVQLDGPHGGRRNVSGGDTQFLMFNLTNPAAIVGNFQQGAAEVAWLAGAAPGFVLDGGACPGASEGAPLRAGRVALIGHSMGATLAPIATALSPDVGAMIVSGAGGSYIENLLYKQRPLDVKPLAEQTIGYAAAGRSLHAFDPVLTLVQMVSDPADPLPYAPRVVPGDGAPRHVLMFQGIVDHYILPPIANPLALSLGLDLAGDELTDPEIAAMAKLTDELPFVGRGQIALPAAGNLGSSTGVVVQRFADGVEDGHEVMFQRPESKVQLRRFLRTWADGDAPEVPEAAP